MARLDDGPKTVLSTYAHLLPQSDEQAAERVARDKRGRREEFFRDYRGPEADDR